MVGLNPEQQSAVDHTHTPLLVLAGAGSGKTRVITTKIGHMINQLGYQPHSIYAVTFTNKAAREMKERTIKMLGNDRGGKVSITTFHTLGLRFLHTNGDRAGLRKGMSILDTGDTLSLMREVLREQEISNTVEPEPIRWQISEWKNDLISPDQALIKSADDIEARAAIIFGHYDRALRAYNAVDFDDLISLPVQLLSQHADLRSEWQNRIKHLLLDEYQDTNAAQYEFVKHLMGTTGTFTAVGDDDQSIYAWRGARPENLALLEKDFPRMKLIKLEQNYRSTGRILHAANTLIANNAHLFEKKLWSAIGPGEKLRAVSCRDPEDEANYLAGEILSHKFRNKKPFAHYAILYRSNHQSRLLEKALREKNVPYKITGGSSFFEKSEVKDILSYLRLLTNPDDDTAFLRVVNTPRREIGTSTLEKLGIYAHHRNTSLLKAAGEMGLSTFLSERAFTRVKNFYDWIKEIEIQANELEPCDLIERLMEDCNYQAWLFEIADNQRAAETAWKNVQDLMDWINNLYQGNNKHETIADIVQHLALMDMLEGREPEEQPDEVQMLTLHASKGLEYPYVYIVGMEEGFLPHQQSIEDDDIEQERRLAYVGITRGQKEVTFTYCAKRRRAGETVGCDPSRFLHELHQEDLIWIGGKNEKLDPELSHQTGMNALAGLKAMLSEQGD